MLNLGSRSGSQWSPGRTRIVVYQYADPKQGPHINRYFIFILRYPPSWFSFIDVLICVRITSRGRNAGVSHGFLLDLGSSSFRGLLRLAFLLLAGVFSNRVWLLLSGFSTGRLLAFTWRCFLRQLAIFSVYFVILDRSAGDGRGVQYSLITAAAIISSSSFSSFPSLLLGLFAGTS